MRLFLKIIFFLVILDSVDVALGQELNKICPISLKKGTGDSSSFLLTIADYNYFRGLTVKYAPSIEVIDADQPWPPRWFGLHPCDTASDLTTSDRIMLNASIQNDKLLFFTVIPNGGRANNLAILICNKNMEVADTFYRSNGEIDSHDFKLSANDDMMYFAGHDTIMDLRRISNDAADSVVKLIYETIEISDAKGKSTFSWNPLVQMGFHAVYLPYRHAPGVMSGNSTFEWSHGNSLQYDYDGNILYSFKHIGIGKISRTDGHVMWHIDRIKQKANSQSDVIPIYLQHDLQVVKDAQGNIFYTILSNGDDQHQQCEVYQFTVNYDKKGTPVIKLIKKIAPIEKISNTGGGGNFDIEADGNYIFNYGLYKQDTTLKERILMEYKNEKNNTRTEYAIAPSIFSYRIHKMTEWSPSRPVISNKNGALISDSKAPAQKWYRLSGTDLHTVNYAGKGDTFTPKEEGYYCVSVKSGFGWAVSRPFKFDKK